MGLLRGLHPEAHYLALCHDDPDDVAIAMLYLASDQAGFLTGVSLDVDGGKSI